MMVALPAELTDRLDALDPADRQRIESQAIAIAFPAALDAALGITEKQALGDGKFLELLLKLLEMFLPILIEILLGGIGKN